MAEYDEKLTTLYNNIVAYEIATEEEVGLVTCVCGYNEKVLNSIVEVRTGYKTLEDYIENEINEVSED